jgi:hypothetical protein
MSPKVRYRLYKILGLDVILSKFSPFDSVIMYSLRPVLILFFHLRPCFLGEIFL